MIDHRWDRLLAICLCLCRRHSAKLDQAGCGRTYWRRCYCLLIGRRNQSIGDDEYKVDATMQFPPLTSTRCSFNSIRSTRFIIQCKHVGFMQNEAHETFINVTSDHSYKCVGLGQEGCIYLIWMNAHESTVSIEIALWLLLIKIVSQWIDNYKQ